LKVSFINLDPGVEELPYTPQIDVREYVNVRDVMRRYGLGPNGALIKSIDMLLQYKDLIKEKIGEMDADYIMVDTRGRWSFFSIGISAPSFSMCLGRWVSRSL